MLPLQANDLVGGYKIIRELGKGGMAIVYEAKQPNIPRHVALKILMPHIANSPDTVERFKREIVLLATTEHPHILPIIDAGYDHDRCLNFISMRLVNGGSLEEHILKHGKLELTEVKKLIDKIGSGLAYAHEHQVVHRDIKPSNILLDQSGNPYIADFGIAKVLSQQQSITKTASLIGTPAYMSPEQLNGAEVDTRSDIFALGIMLFQMLHGTLPLESKTPQEYIARFFQEDLRIVERLEKPFGRPLAKIVGKMTTRDPEERYQKVDEFLEAFGDVVYDIEAETHPYRPRNFPPPLADTQTITIPNPITPKTEILSPNEVPRTESLPTAAVKIPIPRQKSAPINFEDLSPRPAATPPLPPKAMNARPSSSPRKVNREFSIKSGSIASAPLVCPVCLGNAKVAIHVTIQHTFPKETFEIYFCDSHTKHYQRISLLQILAHLAFIVGIGIGYVVLSIPGVILLTGFYIFFWDTLNKLGSAETREAHKAVIITRKNKQLHFVVAHNRYAKAFYQENAKFIE